MSSKPDFSDAAHCPVRQVLDRFGDKWSILILLLLGERGTMRFGELHRAIGDISQKMLTSSLRHLEADGLVLRQAYAVIPPKVEYGLSPLGESLLPNISRLTQWAAEHFETIQNSRKTFAQMKQR